MAEVLVLIWDTMLYLCRLFTQNIGSKKVSPRHNHYRNGNEYKNICGVFRRRTSKGIVCPQWIGCNQKPDGFIDNFKQYQGQHFERAQNSNPRYHPISTPDRPSYGISNAPHAFMVENMRPGIVGKKHKHQCKKYSQAVDIDTWNALIPLIISLEKIERIKTRELVSSIT